MKTTSHKLIFLLFASMLIAAVPCISNAQGLQSGEFDGSGQNLKSFWEVQNTFWHVQDGNEGSYMLSDSNLVVEGAFYQNLWDADWTRRFYQVTDQEKFSVETSLIFDHKDVCAVAGLAIKSPTQNEWVTLKMWGYGVEDPWGGSGNTAVLQFQRRENHLHNAFGYNPAGGNIPIALRLDRDGDTYTAWYKPDAQGEWVFTGETTVTLQGPLEVGIFTGICQDEAPGGLTVTFDYFRATTDAAELARQAQAGPKIEGPWLWTIVPTDDKNGEQAVTSGIDYLSEASNGGVSEIDIATEGARAGDIVGYKRWTPGKIAPMGVNNMNDLVNAIGLATGDVDYHVAYGVIALDSPSEQVTTMYAGSDDTVRVWLNGTLVHSNPVGGGAIGYQESFPITLKQGKNTLLVAVYESWGGWSGFFGFEKGVTYTVLPPEMSTTPPVDIAQGYSQIYVDAVNGINARTGRGSADKPYKTITFALAISANLPDPWYVRIRPGTYHADPTKPVQDREIFPLKLRNGMIIEGTTNANECIIDAQHLGETLVPILLGENVGGVHIRNLTIQNMNNVGEDRSRVGNEAQIMLTGTAGRPNTLDGCIVRGVKGDVWETAHGLWTDIPLVLVGNTFINNPGAGVGTDENVIATNNTFDGNKRGGLIVGGRLRGAWVDADSTGNITGNIFHNNGWGNSALHISGTLHGNISNNAFIGNTHQHTMYITNMTGDVTHNTFENNATSESSATLILITTFNGNLTHNTFTGNSDEVDLRKMNGDISYNKFTGNSAPVEVSQPITIKVSHNIFDSNTDNNYGNKSGIRIDNRGGSENSVVEISNNIFYNNKSVRASGVSSVSVENRPAHFINNLFMATDESTEDVFAPTIWLDSPECRFHNNIFVGVQTAIYVEGTDAIPITHNIFYSIGKDIVSQAGSGYGNDLELWELLAGNASNNLALIPLFVDPLIEKDFHLKPISPAIDAGTNMYAPEDDFDGVARPVGDTVDIGPYEYVGKKEDTVFELGAWDVDENGVVNILDLVIVAQNFGLSPPTNPRADVNDDGHVNILDLVTIAQHFGESAGASPSANVHAQGYINPGTVQTWIALAQVADDGSVVFREGIANLKRLLAVNTPQKTALLANYPNPFNPETWIPYQLAKPADVSVSIYAADGKLVRTLALGHQGAGKYYHRSRAAYWDGRNETGESVASGVYFYTFTAGDFTATRKMLIRK